MQACADLQQEVPTDTQVLNLLTVVLKAAGQQKELAGIYAAASAARPRSSELLRGLFTAHVACGPEPVRGQSQLPASEASMASVLC